MFHFNSLRISNNIDDDIIINIDEDYTYVSNINEKLGYIPTFIGIATYSLVSGLPNINWQSESYNLWLTVNGVEFELKKLEQKAGTLVITTSGTYTAGVGGAYFEFNVTGTATTIVVDDFSAGHYFWITNNKESYLPPITLSYSSGQYTYVITNGKTIQFFVLEDYDAELEDNNDYIFAFNYTEINVEDSDLFSKIESIKLSNGVDEDFILEINENYGAVSNINQKFEAIPTNIGVATYSLVDLVPTFNWTPYNGHKFYLKSDSPWIELKHLIDSTPIKLPTNTGTYYTIEGDQNKIIQVTDELLMAVDFGIFSPGETAWVRNVKPDESFVWVGYELASFQVQFGESYQFAILGSPNGLLKFIYIELNVEDSDFVCHQPDFLNGIYNGSNYVLIDATELPNGLKIYLNTGEFGYVKDAKCLIKLDSPLETGNVIYCFVDTNNCNVQSCEYVVGEYVSGEVGCIDASGILPEGTLTGSFICLDTDLHKEVFNEYGQKVAGIVVQENCYLCGGTEPSCV